MNRMRYSMYAVEKGGKFLKNDFANYSRTADRAARMRCKVARITIEHQGAYRDIGDLLTPPQSTSSLSSAPSPKTERQTVSLIGSDKVEGTAVYGKMTARSEAQRAVHNHLIEQVSNDGVRF
jgi:hypothetical protein